MKLTFLIAATIFAIGCNQKKSESLKGNWKFQYLADSKIKNEEEQSAILWLNQMTEGSIITFSNDSFFLNRTFYGLYNSEKSHIKVSNEKIEYLNCSIEKDTLILIPDNEKSVSLKFTRL